MTIQAGFQTLESPSGACDDRAAKRSYQTPGCTMPITLLIADEFEVVRAGLKSMLAGKNIKTIAEASTGKEAFRLTRKHKPDVAIFGVRMPEGDGLNSLGRIKLDQPEQPVLMFLSFDDLAHAVRAFGLGAKGWVSSTMTRQQLLTAIHTAAMGESTWTRQELRRIKRARITPQQMTDVDALLTPREFDVLRGMVSGQTNKEIAQTLNINHKTAQLHMQHIIRKLRVVDRTQAVVWAVRKGFA